MAPLLHVLSKNGTFLFRFNNGEFGSKWCGVWNGRTKYFDYFAFELDGEFLSEKNIDGFQYYNSQFSKMEFKTSKGTVDEEVVCTDKNIMVTIKPRFECEASAEVGINIRDRNENYNKGKKYETSTEDDYKVKTEINGLKAFILFDKGKFEKNEFYGIHSPGRYSLEKGITRYLDDGSVQNRYVPGRITAKLRSGEEFTIVLSLEDMDRDGLYKAVKNRLYHSKEHGDLINATAAAYSGMNFIDNGFYKDVIDSIYSYADMLNKGIYAGFPYFNEFWTRDALVVLPSFLSMNNAKFVKDVLEKIAEAVTENGLPNVIGGNVFPMDAPALFIIDLIKYYKWTGDSATLKKLLPKAKVLAGIAAGRVENGLVHDRGRETWMDSMDREYSIEIQALWSKAFSDISEITGEDDEFYKLSKSIFNNLTRYAREGYLSDNLNADTNGINQIFPLMLGQVDNRTGKTIIENINNSMLTDFGPTSVSKNDKSFDFNGYHNGAVWPFTTAMFAASCYRYGRMDIGEKCLNIMQRNNFGAQCTSRINEIFQPNGEPKGCPSQAWSIGMLPSLIDELILGIHVDVPNGRILVDEPLIDIDINRKIFVKNKEIELKFKGGFLKSNIKMERVGGSFIINL